MTDSEVRQRVEDLEAQLAQAESSPETLDLVQALSELYGEAIRRLIYGADPRKDELVSHLLMLHAIEPPTLLQITPRQVQHA